MNMETRTANNDDIITLKSLKNHLLKSVIVAIAVTLVTAFFTYVGFYYTTVIRLANQEAKTTELTQEFAKGFSEMNDKLNSIESNISNSSIYNTNNKERINDFEKRLDRYENKMDEMYKILIEIKRK